LATRPSTRKRPYLIAPAAPLPESNRPIAERLDELEREARNGNPDSGYVLGLELMHCQALDGRYAELEGNLAAHPELANNIARQVDALDMQHEHCKGLSDEQLSGWVQWVELAASRGSVTAQVAYPTLAGQLLLLPDHVLNTVWIDEYKANSRRFLESAAATGSVDAMSQLAFFYSEALMTPKDMTTAYAYAYAVSQTGLVKHGQKMLELWERDMTPEQIEIARRRGAEILNRCCT
jgi:TPR repeat protein